MKWQGRRKSGNLEDRRGGGNKGKIIAGGGLVAVIVLLLQIFGGETGQQLAPLVEQVGNSQVSQPSETRELTEKEQLMGVLH